MSYNANHYDAHADEDIVDVLTAISVVSRRLASELGFADEVLKRSEVPEDMETPAVSMLYSKAAVVNSLMDKIAAKCKTKPKPEPQGRSVDSLYERLNLMKF